MSQMYVIGLDERCLAFLRRDSRRDSEHNDREDDPLNVRDQPPQST